MKQYNVLITDQLTDVLTAEMLELSYFYGGKYRPKTTAQVVYVKDIGLACHMQCFETGPEASVTETDGPTYKDSCMEWFINCNPEEVRYYLNLEANSIGTLHCKIGSDRTDRYTISDKILRPLATARVYDERWTVDFLLPDETIKAVFGKDELKSGDVLKANFYKCGDETAHPHYGLWNEVRTEKPDFHRPEFFGTLILCDKN